MGPPAVDEGKLTCEEAGQLHEAYAAGELAAEQKAAFETHCRECEACRRLVEQLAEEPEAPAPPPYLAAEIKQEARQRKCPERNATRKRAIGSPQFLAICAVIAAGVILALVATYHMNNMTAREDAWAPAIIVTSGGGVITLTDAEDPMRELSREEILEKMDRHGHVPETTSPETPGETTPPQPEDTGIPQSTPPADQ